MPETTASIVLKLKDEATKSLKGLNKEIVSFGTVLKGLTVAVGAVVGVGTAIALMAAKGEDLRTMRNLFATLSENAGSSMDEMVAALNRGAEGLISQTDLMKGSLKLLANTNLPVTAEAMELVAEASKRLGIATGVGAKEAFDRFGAAIATGRTKTLAHLGVVVDTTDEIEKLAKATGRSVSEIGFAEEQTTIYNAILRETAGALERAGDFSVGFGGQVDQLKTSIVNFKDELFAFTSAFADAFLESFKEATGVQLQFGTALKFNTKIITEFVKTALVGMIDGFILVSDAVTSLLNILNLLQTAIGFIAGGFADLFDSILAGAQLVNETMLAIAEKIAPSQAKGFREVVDSIKSMRTETIAMRDSMNEWGAQGLQDIEENRKSLDGLIDSAANLRAEIQDIDAADIARDMAGISTAVGNAANAVSDELAPGLEASANAAKEITKATEDTAAAAVAASDATASGIAQALASGDVVGAVRNLGDMLEGVAVLGIDIGAILNAITSINKELPKLLFSSIKDLLINLVAELPLLIGNIIPDLVIPILKLVPVILQRFVENLPIMIDAIIRSLPELIQALISMTPNLIKVIPSLLTSVLNTWFQGWWAEQKPVLVLTLKEAALEMIEFFRSGIGGIMVDVGNAFDEFVTQPFIETMTSAFTKFNDIMQDGWDSTFGLLPEIARQAGDAIAGPLDEIVDAFNRTIDRIPGAGGGNGGVVGQVRGALGFQAGTPFVPFTGPAIVHRGEMITEADRNPNNPNARNAGGLGGGMTVNLNFTFPPGMPQDQAQQVISLFERNERTIADKVRRVLDRTG